MTAKTGAKTATIGHAGRAQTALPRCRTTPPRTVIAFPVFERHADQIEEWLAAIGDCALTNGRVLQIAKTMRSLAAKLARVEGSVRHQNLASFVGHAANSLEASEWQGARYLLITSLALLSANPSFASWQPAVVRQLPLPAPDVPEEAELAEAAMGIVIG
jgi:hypothetical protein